MLSVSILSLQKKKFCITYYLSGIPKSGIDPRLVRSRILFFCIELKEKEIHKNVQNFKLYISRLVREESRGVADS
jgi:hypothetical protein